MQISKLTLFLLGVMGSFHIAFSQNKKIDVQHYRFEVEVNDTTDVIQGKAEITFKSNINAKEVYFDLIEQNEESGKGMQVTQVQTNNGILDYSQKGDKFYISFNDSIYADGERIVSIWYEGIPKDGLVIGKNQFGKRTFFADHWPERAHNWLPTNDHPSDKASVDFLITAPNHYQVIANGVKKEETGLPRGRRLTHWRQDKPLSTKIMAIGVADFAVDYLGKIEGTPIQSWVFSDNRNAGFAQYKVAEEILPFYTAYIAPYPYVKLANVQSKTRFGGLENASNIFYSETSITPDSAGTKKANGKLEALIAHEMAHQWFGDEASEKDWQHLWLSEGFATYFPNLYFEKKYGKDSLETRLARDRKKVIVFSKKRQTPVVDETANDNPMKLLNPNSYQKGGWVLHMLRRKLGDDTFQKGIRTYYKEYEGKNASTNDFRRIMEEVSREDLKQFFKQWLFTAGQPKLEVSWKYNEKRGSLNLTLKQVQKDKFVFPLEIEFKNGEKSQMENIKIDEKRIKKKIKLSFEPRKINLDPQINLLFEGAVKEEK